jgi:hypothetical protein
VVKEGKRERRKWPTERREVGLEADTESEAVREPGSASLRREAAAHKSHGGDSMSPRPD